MPEFAPSAPALRPKIVRRLSAWVRYWAETRYAVPALVGIAIVEYSFFLIPPCLSTPKRSFRFAAWCSVASVAGGRFGYPIASSAESRGRRFNFDLLHQGAAWDVVEWLSASPTG
ncbi:MAG TPA: hypothetical protein VMM36_20120 [Opitutaceae bacterium]|nr:hypothetical protein [Opitutaceae bacterium]